MQGGETGRSGSWQGSAWRRRASLAALRTDRRGSVAVLFGLGATVLIGLAGGASDYARLIHRRSQLQAAVDAGTLAGGNALKLAASTPASIVGLTEQTIRDAAKAAPDRPITVNVTVSEDRTGVFARAEESIRLTFGAFVGYGSTIVAAKARANIVGRMRLCMLALDPGAAGAFNLQKNAQVTANNCSLYSNSRNPMGMVGGDNALAKAQTICSSGGYLGPRANFSPNPQTDCPAIEDPLKDRPAPTIEACRELPFPLNLLKLTENKIDTTVTLEPGTYCGGLHITKNAVVTLKPGIYVMKDGPLVVDKKATMTGTEVAFYFTGNKGGLVFDKKTTISLTAPTTGVMAGLLMSEERTVALPIDPTTLVETLVGDIISPTPPALSLTKPLRVYRIISDNARTMLGTIYLPSGRLVIDASKPVADQSAYTVVVAQQLNLYEGPNLYLNANYDATSVPVPKGVGPVSGKLMLTQ
ncbi:Flp pilus assembly protein TadG [Methylobacterium sp. BE186]|uniref:TadE/TadG family type IV pilus assembly protein n=1 Tax=Methylobacterium sp. BE186 TaxID=2817715 RepID=UPI002865BDD3|nr:pilus assembly protein [Methylobacterium sp. BE186]MDR7036138.1 Flp pilus assembly protein TadG [Methylobacterium sp. BE186]